MAENRRKSENIRRANRVIQTRTFVLMLVLGVAVLAASVYYMTVSANNPFLYFSF